MSNDSTHSVEFASTEARDMAVRGLLDLRALFEMRVREAEEANDTIAADIAFVELDIVAEALRGFNKRACPLIPC